MENNLSIVKDKFKELPNNIEAEQSVIGSILVTVSTKTTRLNYLNLEYILSN